MGKKVHKLIFNPEYDFFLAGLSSHENDYRISWALNNTLEIGLKKSDDHSIIDNKYPEPLTFSRFTHDDNDSMLSYRLLSNRCQDGFLIGEMKNIDYFLIIFGELNKTFVNKLLKKVNELSMVNTAFQINPNKLKSRQNLLF